MSSREGCKIDEVVDEYQPASPDDEFDTIHEHLLALWTGEDGRESHGYRSLSEWFNKRLIKSVYDEHGRSTLGTRLDNDYEMLMGGDEIKRGELIDDLQRDGINGERIAEDMISWSTMRRHLLNCLGGEKSAQSAETDWERDSVDIATNQLTERVEKALSSYENKDRIDGATEANISVQIHLSCPECPTRRSLSDALKQGYVCKDHLGAANTD